jgi:hypothetical protein
MNKRSVGSLELSLWMNKRSVGSLELSLWMNKRSVGSPGAELVDEQAKRGVPGAELVDEQAKRGVSRKLRGRACRYHRPFWYPACTLSGGAAGAKSRSVKPRRR